MTRVLAFLRDIPRYLWAALVFLGVGVAVYFGGYRRGVQADENADAKARAKDALRKLKAARTDDEKQRAAMEGR